MHSILSNQKENDVSSETPSVLNTETPILLVPQQTELDAAASDALKDYDYQTGTTEEGRFLSASRRKRHREYQEDFLVFSIMGIETFAQLSETLQRKTLEITFEKLQERCGQNDDVGSTGCFAIAWREGNLVKIRGVNLGDSMAAYYIFDSDKNIIESKPLHVLHNFEINQDEVIRVESEGGCVRHDRLNYELALSRSFGDNRFAACGLSHEPTFFSADVTLQEGFEIVIQVSSDGITNNLQNIGKVITHCPDLAAISTMMVAESEGLLVGMDNASVVMMTPGFSAAAFDGHAGSQVSQALAEALNPTLLETIGEIVSNRCESIVAAYDQRCAKRADDLTLRKENSIKNIARLNDIVTNFGKTPFIMEVSHPLISALDVSLAMRFLTDKKCMAFPNPLEDYNTNLIWTIAQQIAYHTVTLTVGAGYAVSTSDEAYLIDLLDALKTTYVCLQQNASLNKAFFEQCITSNDFPEGVTVEHYSLNQTRHMAGIRLTLPNSESVKKIALDIKNTLSTQSKSNVSCEVASYKLFQTIDMAIEPTHTFSEDDGVFVNRALGKLVSAVMTHKCDTIWKKNVDRNKTCFDQCIIESKIFLSEEIMFENTQSTVNADQTVSIRLKLPKHDFFKKASDVCESLLTQNDSSLSCMLMKSSTHYFIDIAIDKHHAFSSNDKKRFSDAVEALAQLPITYQLEAVYQENALINHSRFNQCIAALKDFPEAIIIDKEPMGTDLAVRLTLPISLRKSIIDGALGPIFKKTNISCSTVAHDSHFFVELTMAPSCVFSEADQACLGAIFERLKAILTSHQPLQPSVKEASISQQQTTPVSTPQPPIPQRTEYSRLRYFSTHLHDDEGFSDTYKRLAAP